MTNRIQISTGSTATTPTGGRPRFGRGAGFRGRSQGGFTLIEVLVAVLVLLVGMLGVVGMQMLSFQANQGAYFRSQAVYIASEILDAMREAGVLN